MFEQSIVERERKTRRPWAVAVSFLGQVVVVGLLILTPLVFTERLPASRLGGFHLFTPATGTRARETQRGVKLVRVPQTYAVRPGALVAPRQIPAKVAMVMEEPINLPGMSALAGETAGHGGGTGAGDVINSMLGRTLEIAPPAPPPTPARSPERKDAHPPVRIKVGGLVQQAKLIQAPQPVYPALARQARISGTVRLAAVIGRDGRIANLRVITGHPMLVPAAVDAVRQWEYQPTLLNGDPVEVATEIDVNFTLGR
jgi:protein TonB